MNLSEKLRNWLLQILHIEPAQPRQLTVQESLTFEDNAALNLLWYTGDAEELSEVYSQIVTAQPHIEHEGYLAAYMTALDLSLQGLISPSTLGIDVKKLDNAEAQREKEKATLYTRNRIVQALQKTLPELFRAALWLYAAVTETTFPDGLEITAEFGEYANPSFEAQVETLGKARSSRILSNEALVDELWGDTKTAQWKSEECARLNALDGMTAPSDEVDF